MIRQIRYFQSVIRNNSFSQAAVECHISQSAISQQIQSLERELGFSLLQRANRKFTLTAAGEHFYRKSLVLISDFDRLCSEAAKIARSGEATLRVGCLRNYGGQEFHQALGCFSEKYPDVLVQITYGNHEELYDLLRFGNVDVVMNDQRRAFSSEYKNMTLAELPCQVEVAARDPIVQLPFITPLELRNTPCILVSSKEQQNTEREYYANIIGFQGEFLFVETMDEARAAIVSGQGILPIEGGSAERVHGIVRVPLYRGEKPVTRIYCAFWKQDNSGYYVEEFADILKQQFEQ